MPDYSTVLLGDLAKPEKAAIAIGPFGSRMKADIYVPDGVPVIRGTNISSTRALKGDWVYVSEDFAATIPGCALKDGDLVFPHRGSIGEVALIDPAHAPMVLSSSMMKFRPDPGRLNSRFAYYFFKSKAGREEIMRFASQVGTPGIGQPLASLRQFRIPLPSLRQQDEIAEVLALLDDKIELNRRMSETLEAMAVAIFRDWFVDFGPVRRKLAGVTDPVEIIGGLTRGPVAAAELARLFPSHFDERDVPTGWAARPLDQVAEFLNGLALQKFPAAVGEASLPAIKIAELRGGLSERSDRVSRGVPDRYIINDGDYIFSWSGSLLAKVWTEGEGALNQHLFKVTSVDHPQWFFAGWVQYHMPEFQQIAASKATTMGHIQRCHLSAAVTVCPPAETISRMSAVLDPIWLRMIHNSVEARTLAEIRDYLLPRLMSGEVSVGDVSQEIAA